MGKAQRPLRLEAPPGNVPADRAGPAPDPTYRRCHWAGRKVVLPQGPRSRSGCPSANLCQMGQEQSLGVDLRYRSGRTPVPAPAPAPSDRRHQHPPNWASHGLVPSLWAALLLQLRSGGQETVGLVPHILLAPSGVICFWLWTLSPTPKHAGQACGCVPEVSMTV